MRTGFPEGDRSRDNDAAKRRRASQPRTTLAPCLLTLLLAGCATPPPSAPEALRWDRRPDSLGLLRQDTEVWRFHHGNERHKPCFHPLALPAGVLTLDQPADHRWHYGLWFSWKLINGVNYWENDERTGRPVGRTSWTVSNIEARDDHSARIALQVRYGPSETASLLTEERVLEVSAPAADGSFAIDWSSAFAAEADCLLDRTPVPGEPDGKPNGGYAGFALRLRNLEGRQAVTTEGPVTWNKDDRFRTRAVAMEYDAMLAGQPVGIAILDHPSNLNAPSPWYAIRSKAMTFFNAAVICLSPQRLAKGQRFTLRYRVCVHPGHWDQARLAAEQTEFSRKP